MRSQQQIVVKRSSRSRNEDSSSGGAWKVAFADFTLAMMALFLVLWILAVSSMEEREELSSTLREYSVFDGQPNPFELGNSPAPLDLEGNPSVLEGIAAQLLSEGNHINGPAMYDPQSSFPPSSPVDKEFVDNIFESEFDSVEALELLGEIIEEMGRQLGALDNLSVEVVPQGLRIRLQDNDARQMFERGGVRMHSFFEDMLMALAPVFQRLENGLIISGHTDSIPFEGKNYSNWELSGERAALARKVLDAGGTPGQRVLQIAAMADRTPAQPEDPASSANRRIEILVLTQAAQDELLGLFDDEKRDEAVRKAREAAVQNQPVTR